MNIWEEVVGGNICREWVEEQEGGREREREKGGRGRGEFIRNKHINTSGELSILPSNYRPMTGPGFLSQKFYLVLVVPLLHYE